jgi:predicted SnoaL-like aldol condensation-catalyzing enzyme
LDQLDPKILIEQDGVLPERKKTVSQTQQEKNKALVLEAFDTVFNKRDYAAAERHWSSHYVQHSAHIAPGRDGLFNLIKSIPPTLKYEPGMIVAEADFVIVHGRLSGFGAPVNWFAADIGAFKTEFWSSIGMLFRMRPQKSNRKAPLPCSEKHPEV